MKNVLKKDSGFTLIELLVAMLILGILALIAGPALFKDSPHVPDVARLVEPAKHDYCVGQRLPNPEEECRAHFGQRKLDAYCVREIISNRLELACTRSARAWAYPFALLGKIEQSLLQACTPDYSRKLLHKEVDGLTTRYQRAVERRTEEGLSRPGILSANLATPTCNGGTGVVSLKQ